MMAKSASPFRRAPQLARLDAVARAALVARPLLERSLAALFAACERWLVLAERHPTPESTAPQEGRAAVLAVDGAVREASQALGAFLSGIQTAAKKNID